MPPSAAHVGPFSGGPSSGGPSSGGPSSGGPSSGTFSMLRQFRRRMKKAELEHGLFALINLPRRFTFRRIDT
jgi:hypothetical protein